MQGMARSAKVWRAAPKKGKEGEGGSHSQNNSEFPEVPKLIAQSIIELIARAIARAIQSRGQNGH